MKKWILEHMHLLELSMAISKDRQSLASVVEKKEKCELLSGIRLR